MFTAMARRPFVWLLAALVVLGAGWLAYEYRRGALEPPSAGTQAPSQTAGTEGAPETAPPEAGQVEPQAPAPAEPKVLAEPPPAEAFESRRELSATEPPASPGGRGVTGAERGEAGIAALGDRSTELPTAGVQWPHLRELAPGAGPPSLGTQPPVRLPAPPEEQAEKAEPAPVASAPAPSAPENQGASSERQPARSLVTDTIRRALAALLGNSSKEPDAGLGAAVEPSKAGESEATGSEAAVAPSSGAVPPSFDIVRVERGGGAVIAGRAEPGTEVEVRAGDRVIDRVRASRRGDWVATPVEPLAPGAQELTLAARRDGESAAVESEHVVVVTVPEPTPPVAEAAAPAEAVAVLLPKDARGHGRILQAPGRISSNGRLALMVVDYDESGRIRLTGEAPPGAPIRLYVDNRPAGEVAAGPNGQWSAVLDRQLSPGDYTLRLDQLDASGHPVARLETPFTRVTQPPIEGKVQVDYVIVQPGNSLWRIARRLYGKGMTYVHIYEANEGQIRDPDLIYPGQVFEIPAGIGAAG
jgi:nucleoid-associated protein YgaU